MNVKHSRDCRRAPCDTVGVGSAALETTYNFSLFTLHFLLFSVFFRGFRGH